MKLRSVMSLGIGCVLVIASLAGCFKGKAADENVIVSPLEATTTSLHDVADAQKLANDKLAAAGVLAETQAEKATVAEANDLKQRGDALYNQRAYSEANEAYIECIRKCDEIINARAGG